MKAKKKNGVVEHTGSTFDSFLEEEGIREEVEAIAVKRVISWQLAEAMRKKKKTKQALAKELNTSRSQLDRLLDPQNIAVSLDTITRAARALGKRLIIRIADAKGGLRDGSRPRRSREDVLMAKRDIFGELIEGAAAMKSHREGKLTKRRPRGVRCC